MIQSLNQMSPPPGARVARLHNNSQAEVEVPTVAQDAVSLSETPAPRSSSSWLGGKLAKMAVTVGLTAAALGAFTAPAMAHDWGGHHRHHHQPPAVSCQVQTGTQFGIGIDGRGNVGVYIGSEGYDRCTGVYQRGGVSIGPNGVGVDYGVSVPGWGGPQTMPLPGHRHYPPRTMPYPQQQQNQTVIINQGGQVIVNQGGGWFR